MPQDQENTRVINHKVLRQGTGIIALLMPFAVQFLSGEESSLQSISASYWTESGDIFVGSLIAVAFFLAAYNGTSLCQKDAEYWISKAAGLFALFVALVPTAKDGYYPPQWVAKMTFGHTATVHYIAAISLFICLYLLINFFARRAKYKGKRSRSKIYAAIGLGMLIGMPAVYFIATALGSDDQIYWVEVLGLVLFGAGWLVAGSYKTESKLNSLDGAEKLGEFKVDPKNMNYPTDIFVNGGVKYLLIAEGCWNDSFLAAGPTGWGPAWQWWTKRNRMPGQPVFMLCGNIGKQVEDEQLVFGIGYKRFWTAPEKVNELEPDERKLYLFANDWRNRYDNNSGSMSVSIYAIRNEDK
jgi:lipid-A-disaccharide synthase-like uncharacterized protein